jgi:hypothetical protein
MVLNATGCEFPSREELAVLMVSFPRLGIENEKIMKILYLKNEKNMKTKITSLWQ